MKIVENHNYICIAKLVAKEDKLDELLQIFKQLKDLSPQEKGCIRYELHQDQENPNIFTFVDRFFDKEAFDYHCNQDYTIKYFDDILPQLVSTLR